MIIGVPSEIKKDEYRIGMTVGGVEELVRRGHTVLIQQDAGQGSGITDEDFKAAGADIRPTAEQIWADSEMIVKVKEPQPEEVARIREGQVVFTYFHFAADKELTTSVLDSKCVAIAYETVYDRAGRLPLLTPMSEVAGKMAVQEGAKYLERPMMGRGILLGGVPGVEPAVVVILGGGVVGTCAAKVAAGLGARVVILDINLDRMRYLNDIMPANVITLYSSGPHIREQVARADLVVGAVLIPGARCPNLVTRQDLATMKPGSVIVDVGIDQGGCIETSRPTTHSEPTYIIDTVVHYCVANMPGAVGRTSTYALTNATLPYVVALADKGYKQACRDDAGLAAGINMQHGRLVNGPVGQAWDIPVGQLDLQ